MSPDQHYRGVEEFPAHLLDIMGNRDTLRLLEATIERPRGAGPLIEELGIPRTTVYRRLASFAEHDLVRVGGELVEGVGPEMTVSTNLDSLALALDGDRYRMDVAFHEEPRIPQGQR